MAFRFFAPRPISRVLAGGSALGALGLAASQSNPQGNGDYSATEAEIQFATSFGYIQGGQQLIKPPKNWSGALFKIRNDYPKVLDNYGIASGSSRGVPILPGPDRPPPSADPRNDAPWLRIDFKTDPRTYCALIKAYCWEGNVNNGFILEKNQIRQWYHAPWMHWNENGREPLNGLTFERPTPPLELSRTQDRFLQNWACGYYNATGATVFGKIWDNKNDPKWEKLKFPEGTCVFKILMTDATDKEIPSMQGSPAMKAVIAQQPTSTQSTAAKRIDIAADVRLLQVDFAVRDDRAPIGWVFGAYMYDSSQKQQSGWDRIIPVGLMWGNDPDLTTARAQAVDNFISACASCHSVSERSPDKTKKPASMVPPENATDEEKMQWFRNLPAGESFSKGDVSGDYSLQLMIGYSNYESWRNSQKGLWYRTKLAVPFSQTRKEADAIDAKRAPLRAGVPPDQVGTGKK